MKIKGVSAYKFLVPGLVGLLIALIIPDIGMIWYSFTNYSGNIPYGYDTLTLVQYEEIFTGRLAGYFDTLFLWNTVWAAGTTAAAFFIGIGLAITLNDPKMESRFIYRTLFILPWAFPAALSMFIWNGLYSSQFTQTGVVPLNELLSIPGIGTVDIPWLTNGLWAKVSVLIANIWTAFPFMMAVGLGALQSIPRGVHEAAALDGASTISKFRHVILPMIRRAMTPVVIFTFIFHFHNITPILLVTDGGPLAGIGAIPGKTDTLASFAYYLAFGRGDELYAKGAAYTVIIFIILVVLATIAIKKTGTLEQGVRES